MVTYTENYNLEKPAQSDLYNIDVFNENADKIDEALGDKAENQSLAPIESSATASRNYSIGQQFVYNGLLYEATSAIASGGTITPGSNCARTTVAEELSALNDSLANVLKPKNGLNAAYDMNSVDVGIYYQAGGASAMPAHSPAEYYNGIIFVFKGLDSQRVQFWYSINLRALAVRETTDWSNGSSSNWTTWKPLAE